MMGVCLCQFGFDVPGVLIKLLFFFFPYFYFWCFSNGEAPIRPYPEGGKQFPWTPLRSLLSLLLLSHNFTCLTTTLVFEQTHKFFLLDVYAKTSLCLSLQFIVLPSRLHYHHHPLRHQHRHHCHPRATHNFLSLTSNFTQKMPRTKHSSPSDEHCSQSKTVQLLSKIYPISP